MHTTIPLFIATGNDTPRSDLPLIERDAITAVVFDPRTNRYLGLTWKQVDWDTLVTGGIEEGQTAEAAARAEIEQETGYKNLRLLEVLPRYDAQFYHGPKRVNRFAHFQCLLFETIDDERTPVSDDERAKHDCIWLSPQEIQTFRLPEGHRFLMDYVLARKVT